MLRKVLETTLIVKDLVQSSAYYLNIMENPHLLVNGSFLVKIKSNNLILILKQDSLLNRYEKRDDKVSLEISPEFVDTLRENLEQFGIAFVDDSQDMLIKTSDLDENPIFIKIKKRNFTFKKNTPTKSIL